LTAFVQFRPANGRAQIPLKQVFNFRQINSIESRIMTLRLELIGVIANINAILRTDRGSICKPEYRNLKTKYSEIRGQINALKSFRDSLKG
jgi:hypothetical protein